MKLLSLNVMGGALKEPLFEYIKQESAAVDIFCFQEVYRSSSALEEYKKIRVHLFDELSRVLPDYLGFFSEQHSGMCAGEKVDFEVKYGLAVFVLNKLKPAHKQNYAIMPESLTSEDGRVLQRVFIVVAGKALNIFNFHGLAQPGDKLDTPARLEQSTKLAEILKSASGAKILCGDFNLMPNTNSVKIIEGIGMRNLIKAYNITNTRNRISWEMYNNLQYFADYAFISPDIKVNNFTVPYTEVSDHLPMILEFEI